MGWFVNNLAGYVPAILALSVGIYFEFRRAPAQWLRLALVCFCCVSVLGFGWLLQSIIDDAFFTGVLATGLGYRLEFTPLSYVASSIIVLLRFGLTCGPFLAVLFIN